MKTYSSKTEISINISMPNGSAHIHFNPVSSGGSVYQTNNPDIQKGLESHSRFGQLFILEGEVTPVVEEQAVEQEAKVEIKTVKVGSVQEAVDYLIEQGISRTKLRNKSGVISQAKAINVEFDGI